MWIPVVFFMMAVFAATHHQCHSSNASTVYVGGTGGRQITTTDMKDFVSAVKDGISMANDMMTAFKWPVTFAMSLADMGVSLVVTSMSWFHFIVDLIKPGGIFEDLVAFLRGGSMVMKMPGGYAH